MFIQVNDMDMQHRDKDKIIMAFYESSSNSIKNNISHVLIMAHMNKSNTYTEKVTAKFLIRRKELFFDSKTQLTH